MSLVYNRIDQNTRATRRLLAAFGLVSAPVVSAGAVILLPIVSVVGAAIAFLVYGRGLAAKIEALNAATPTGVEVGLRDLPSPVLTIIGLALAVALIVMIVAVVGLTAFLVQRYGARIVLRAAGAKPVTRESEFVLWSVVENLCIGAGLPCPAIYVIESPAPNALATGMDPDHSSLAVTRGLLALLNRRELEGVVGHELSHIGNHDIRLTTTLAAFVGTVSLPLRVLTAPVMWAFRHSLAAGFVGAAVLTSIGLSMVSGILIEVGAIARGELAAELPPFLQWYAVHAMLAPLYALTVAPVAALFIRHAVSRQREFLADADAALLTRDPEGLALALLKIGAARGDRLSVGEGSAHLYFVDPGSGPLAWLRRIFPSHPSLQERIDLLAQMGSGIAVRSGPDDRMRVGLQRDARLQA